MDYRVLYKNEQAYKNMQAVADSLTVLSPKGYVYRVKATYLDYGQDWQWTTIIREDVRWGGVQILSPRQWENIIIADEPMQRIDCVIDILKDKYNNDK